MKNYKLTSVILLIVLLSVVGVYYFWPTNTVLHPVKRKKPGTTVAQDSTAKTIPTVSGESTITITSGTTKIIIPLSIATSQLTTQNESEYDFRPYTRAAGYKGIGDRDMFCLLIAPPPPPPPPRETIDFRSRNWVLWEIISKDECIIQDTRTQSHTLKIGDAMDKVVVAKIELDQNRVQLAKEDDKNETKYLTLMPIGDITRGWKLKGTVPGLKTAFIVTGDGKNNKVKEGDILQHVKIKQVLQNKVLFEYGTMSMEFTP
jgi:hypothetical protein